MQQIGVEGPILAHAHTAPVQTERRVTNLFSFSFSHRRVVRVTTPPAEPPPPAFAPTSDVLTLRNLFLHLLFYSCLTFSFFASCPMPA